MVLGERITMPIPTIEIERRFRADNDFTRQLATAIRRLGDVVGSREDAAADVTIYLDGSRSKRIAFYLPDDEPLLKAELEKDFAASYRVYLRQLPAETDAHMELERRTERD